MIDVNTRDYAIIKTQVNVMFEYCKKHNIDPMDYVNMDEKYHLHKFVRDSYDSFDSMGLGGVVEEVEEYIDLKRKNGGKKWR